MHQGTDLFRFALLILDGDESRAKRCFRSLGVVYEPAFDMTEQKPICVSLHHSPCHVSRLLCPCFVGTGFFLLFLYTYLCELCRVVTVCLVGSRSG